MHELTLFDRISLANCAKRRAEMAGLFDERFLSEYRTARMWVKYRCYVTTSDYSYIEAN